MHSSDYMLNDQFTTAYKRPNIVTVKCEISVDDLNSGYHAEGAKDAVGMHDWKSGNVATKLAKKGYVRHVYLTRYIRPVQIVSTDEWADNIAKLLKAGNLSMPFNCVTEEQREALIRRGVSISEPTKGNAGDGSMAEYEKWLNERGGFNKAYSLDDFVKGLLDDVVTEPIDTLFPDTMEKLLDRMHRFNDMQDAIDEFSSENVNAAKTHNVASKFQLVGMLRKSGHSWQEVLSAMLLACNAKCKAFISKVNGEVYILRPALGKEKNKNYLYHENLHYAFQNLFPTMGERLRKTK
jgi:hypothetical protein